MEGLLILLVYPAIGLLVLVFAVLLYLRAGMTRKTYRCPHCKETIDVEFMQASYCNVCGARLRKANQHEDYYDESAS